MKDTALILTNGRLATADAKTAHGLIRGTDRFRIVGVIDPANCGRDAGVVLDGRCRTDSLTEHRTQISGSVGHVVDVIFEIEDDIVRLRCRFRRFFLRRLFLRGFWRGFA